MANKEERGLILHRYLVIIFFLWMSKTCCGTESCVNVTIYGWTVPVRESEALCGTGNGCSSVSPGSRVECHCDHACHFYQDCCADYATDCVSQFEDDFDQIVANIKPTQISCQVPPRSNPTGNEKGYRLVSRCSVTWNNLRTRDKCEGPYDDDDVLQIAPVVVNDQVSFKNVYCALCNRQNLSSNVRPWTFKCESDPLPHVPDNSSTIERIRTLISNCSKWYFEPPTSSTATRDCTMGIIDTCDGVSGGERNVSLSNACRLYTDETKINEEDYKNPHCYLCNKLKETNLTELTDTLRLVACPSSGALDIFVPDSFIPGAAHPSLGEGYPGHLVPQSHIASLNPGISIGDLLPIDVVPPPSISVLIDFDAESDLTSYEEEKVEHVVVITCKNNQVFDDTAQRCINLTCPSGYELVDNMCVRNESVQNLCTDNNSVPLVLNLTCESNPNTASDCDLLSNAGPTIASHLKEGLTEKTGLQLVVERLTLKQNESRGLGLCLHVIEMSANLTGDLTTVEERLDGMFFPTQSEENPWNLTCCVNKLQISVGCGDSEASCPNNSQVVNILNKIYDKDDGNMFFSNETNMNYTLENAMYSLEYLFSNSSDSYRKTESIQVCVPMSSVCPLVTLNASLFVDLPNGSILYAPQNKTFHPHEFLKPDNETIQVCSFMKPSGNKTVVSTRYFLLYHSAGQSITSTIGCSLSIVALLVSFITYLKFKSLRKSICSQLIMSLCICLSVAQLLLLLSGVALSNSKTCTAVAVLGHYLWLAVFGHTVSLASDLYRRFGFASKVGKTNESSRLLVRFLLFSWGIPLVIVITCLGVHLSGLEYIPLSYGTSASCWIGDGITNLYAFGLPIALSILFNGVLFGMVVVGLRRQRNKVKNNKKRKTLTADIVIFVKMSTLLGFTWMFGFLAAFIRVDALGYIFIILNSLQGVFIFIAFICNKRVLTLWRNSCTCTRHARRVCGTCCSSIALKDRSEKTTSTSTASTTFSGSKQKSIDDLISMTESSGNFMSELRKKVQAVPRQ